MRKEHMDDVQVSPHIHITHTYISTWVFLVVTSRVGLTQAHPNYGDNPETVTQEANVLLKRLMIRYKIVDRKTLRSGNQGGYKLPSLLMACTACINMNEPRCRTLATNEIYRDILM